MKQSLKNTSVTAKRSYADTNIYDGAVTSYGGLKEINMLLKWLEEQKND